MFIQHIKRHQEPLMNTIAIASPFTLPARCGNSILARRMQQGLHERGFTVRLFNAAQDDPGEAASLQPDLIHSIHTLRPARWLDRLFSRCHAPLFVTLTGTDYNNLDGVDAHHVTLERYWRKAAALVVFHHEAREYVVSRMPWTEPKMHIIPQGVSAPVSVPDRSSIRKEYGLPAHDIVFLMVSGIRPVKNIPFALEAFQQIEQRLTNVTLVHVGPELDSDEARRVQEIGKKLRSFYLLGSKTRTDVEKLMAGADVFLNTSLHEGMSGALLEAMAAGLPVIATDILGNVPLVRAQHNGCLVSLHNNQELVEAALTLSVDTAQRKALGAQGKQRAIEDFSIQQELDRYHTLYRKILQPEVTDICR